MHQQLNWLKTTRQLQNTSCVYDSETVGC